MNTLKDSDNTSIVKNDYYNFHSSAILLTGLRWVTGWLFFSAFWRRLVLANKLDPDALGYVGEKFNHFLPNAIIIKPMIHYLVTHPDFLHIFLIVFTILEAMAGLGLLLGIFTRASAFAVFSLSLGILFGAGWLGTTCLDEWQIGVLGVIAGLIMMVSGSEKLSLDHFIIQKFPNIANHRWFTIVASGTINRIKSKQFYGISIAIAVFSLALTLYTNQVFHGGVWGTLHNLSIKPHIQIDDTRVTNNSLYFSLYRDEGADVYGAFVIRVSLKDAGNNVIQEWNQKELATLTQTDINNEYIARIKAGKNALIVPLGAKATLQLPLNLSEELTNGNYKLEVEDISGIVWNKQFNR